MLTGFVLDNPNLSHNDDRLALKAVLIGEGRLLGLDLGSKTIGLALSDARRVIASPLSTIHRSKFRADALALEAVVRQHEVRGLVLGLPIEMDGTEGKRCQSTRQFVVNLRELGGLWTGLPMVYHDERLSTSAIQRMMTREMDLSRQRRAHTVDKAAAGWILQGFLDALSRA